MKEVNCLILGWVCTDRCDSLEVEEVKFVCLDCVGAVYIQLNKAERMTYRARHCALISQLASYLY